MRSRRLRRALRRFEGPLVIEFDALAATWTVAQAREGVLAYATALLVAKPRLAKRGLSLFASIDHASASRPPPNRLDSEQFPRYLYSCRQSFC